MSYNVTFWKKRIALFGQNQWFGRVLFFKTSFLCSPYIIIAGNSGLPEVGSIEYVRIAVHRALFRYPHYLLLTTHRKRHLSRVWVLCVYCGCTICTSSIKIKELSISKDRPTTQGLWESLIRMDWRLMRICWKILLSPHTIKSNPRTSQRLQLLLHLTMSNSDYLSLLKHI